jgi:hypothetical protein
MHNNDKSYSLTTSNDMIGGSQSWKEMTKSLIASKRYRKHHKGNKPLWRLKKWPNPFIKKKKKDLKYQLHGILQAIKPIKKSFYQINNE